MNARTAEIIADGFNDRYAILFRSGHQERAQALADQSDAWRGVARRLKAEEAARLEGRVG